MEGADGDDDDAAVDAVPLDLPHHGNPDPCLAETLPCSLPREFSPGIHPSPMPEEPERGASIDDLPMSDIDQRILELE